MNIPECRDSVTWTDYGSEYDCDYENNSDCDNCICVTSQHGDFTGIDPRTGKIFINNKP